VQPPREPSAYLHLDGETLRRWAYFDTSATVLHNTDLLFLHALRPYWHHYLTQVTCLEVDDASFEGLDPFTRSVLERGLENGRVVVAGKQRLDRDDAMRAVDSIALLGTDATIEALRERATALIDQPVREVVLPQRIARLEIEPAWRQIKRELSESPPQLVLFALGWEKVVYASRLVASLGIAAVDYGGSMRRRRRFRWNR
jgi:hypothetical protein